MAIRVNGRVASGNVYPALTELHMQPRQNFQLGHQVDFLGEHHQIDIAAFFSVVRTRPEQVNLRIGIGLTDGVTDDLVFFVG